MGRRLPAQFFVDRDDLALLLKWISDQEELAFLWHEEGEKARNIDIASNIESALVRQHWSAEETAAYDARFSSLKWRAVDRLDDVTLSTYLIWHKPSGAVYVEDRKASELEYVPIDDPFGGWIGRSMCDGKIPLIRRDGNLSCFLIDIDFWPDGIGDCSVYIHGYDWVLAPDTLKNYWRRFKRYLEQTASPARVRSSYYSEDCTWLAWPSALSSADWIEPVEV